MLYFKQKLNLTQLVDWEKELDQAAMFGVFRRDYLSVARKVMGRIAKEDIEEKDYMMYNAPSVFGNSGGGLFHGTEGWLLGLTSRVTVTQLGFGVDVQSWMGFSTHPERLYEFFDHQELQFLYDDNDDYYSAMKRRSDRRRDALRSKSIY